MAASTDAMRATITRRQGVWRETSTPQGTLPAAAAAVGGVLAIVFLALLISWTDSFAALIPALARNGAPVGLYVGIALALLSVSVVAWGVAYGEAYLAALWVTVTFLPGVASAAVILTYVGTAPGTPLHHEALLFGLVAAAGLWVPAGGLLRGLASADIAQSRSFEELRDRSRGLADLVFGGIDALLSDTQTQAPDQPQGPPADGRLDHRRALRGQLLVLASELGFDGPPGAGIRFVSASGYINLWRTLHAAEELLLEIEDIGQVVADASYDDLRLAGSKMSNAATLRVVLRAAVKSIDPHGAGAYLPRLAAPVPPPDGDQAATGGEPSPDDLAEARSVIRHIRRSINEYRDSRWDGLVRERNRLIRTTLVTATAAFVLVGLAVAADVGAAAVAAATAYFLVAAAVGLFARLRIEGATESAVDDYGLFEARLMHTPLVSGLAGVAGVFLAAALPAVTGGTADSGNVALGHVFDLQQNARALLTAGIFGLAPELLVGSLRKQVESIKGDLSTSQAAGGSTPPDSTAATPKA